MTPLRWTREAPKEAGWYWRRPTCHPQCMDSSCVKVGEDADFTADYVLGGCLDSDCEWAGPIAPPEEPRSGDPEAAEEEAT